MGRTSCVRTKGALLIGEQRDVIVKGLREKKQNAGCGGEKYSIQAKYKSYGAS